MMPYVSIGNLCYVNTTGRPLIYSASFGVINHDIDVPLQNQLIRKFEPYSFHFRACPCDLFVRVYKTLLGFDETGRHKKARPSNIYTFLHSRQSKLNE